MRHDPLNQPLLRLPVLLFVALTVFMLFPGSRDLIRLPYSGIETLNLVVQNIDPSSPNASKMIQRGDVIVSVDGERVRNYNHYRYLTSLNRNLSPQTYGLARDGASVSAEVEYAPVPSSIVHRKFGRILVGFTFLLTGLLVLLRRADAIGFLFSLNCTILCYLLSDRPVFPSPVLQIAAELFDDAVILFFPAVFCISFSCFQSERELL